MSSESEVKTNASGEVKIQIGQDDVQQRIDDIVFNLPRSEIDRMVAAAKKKKACTMPYHEFKDELESKHKPLLQDGKTRVTSGLPATAFSSLPPEEKGCCGSIPDFLISLFTKTLGLYDERARPNGPLRVSIPFDQYKGAWQNWESNLKTQPQYVEIPVNKEELIASVKRAHDLHIARVEKSAGKERLQVRCSAQGHSSSRVAETSDYLIVTDLLREMEVHVNTNKDFPKTRYITMQAGVNNYEMDRLLQKHGLCVPYNVVLKTVQQAGLVSVACHGSGAGFGSYSDWLVSMEVIDWKGIPRRYTRPDIEKEVKELQRTSKLVDKNGKRIFSWEGDSLTENQCLKDPYVWPALICNLGMFGVIYSMTFECKPMYTNEIWDVFPPASLIGMPPWPRDNPADLGKTADFKKYQNNKALAAKDLEEMVRSHDYCDVFYWPFNNELWVKRQLKTGVSGIAAEKKKTGVDPKDGPKLYHQAPRTCFHVICCGCGIAKDFCGCSCIKCCLFRPFYVSCSCCGCLVCECCSCCYADGCCGGNNCSSCRNCCQQCVTLRQNYDRVMNGINAGAGNTLYDRMLQYPFLTPDLAVTAFKFIAQSHTVDNVRDAIHWQEFIPSWTVEFLELAFDVGKDFENVFKAIDMLDESVVAFQKKNLYPFNLTMQLRFDSARTRALMSPQYHAHKPDQFVPPENSRPFNGPITCFIEVLCKMGTQGFQDFCKDVGDKWINLPGCRPHWPKQFDAITNIGTKMHEEWDRQDKCLDHFLRVRKLLNVDPWNMFVNDFMYEIIFEPCKDDKVHPGWNQLYVDYWMNNWKVVTPSS